MFHKTSLEMLLKITIIRKNLVEYKEERSIRKFQHNKNILNNIKIVCGENKGENVIIISMKKYGSLRKL